MFGAGSQGGELCSVSVNSSALIGEFAGCIVYSLVTKYVFTLITTRDMCGVWLVRRVCCISSALYRSSVIFVLFSVLAWLF